MKESDEDKEKKREEEKKTREKLGRDEKMLAGPSASRYMRVATKLNRSLFWPHIHPFEHEKRKKKTGKREEKKSVQTGGGSRRGGGCMRL